MYTMKEMTLHNEKGFALVAALIASLILLAVGMLVINMSAGDLISSSMSVGNKKAFSAVESGVYRFAENFTIDPATWTTANGYYNCPANFTAANITTWQTASTVDTNTQFVICTPVSDPNLAPTHVPWGGDTYYLHYIVTVAGQNTSYSSFEKVDIGIGFGPVPLD
jgi:Tfp pilus assembly protein PilX